MTVSLFPLVVGDKNSPVTAQYLALNEKDAEAARDELSSWFPDRYTLTLLPPYEVTLLELGRDYKGAKDLPNLLCPIVR